jgi:hypothetical protein
MNGILYFPSCSEKAQLGHCVDSVHSIPLFAQPPHFLPRQCLAHLSGYCLTCQLTLPQLPAVLLFHAMDGSLH